MVKKHMGEVAHRRALIQIDVLHTVFLIQQAALVEILNLPNDMTSPGNWEIIARKMAGCARVALAKCETESPE